MPAIIELLCFKRRHSPRPVPNGKVHVYWSETAGSLVTKTHDGEETPIGASLSATTVASILGVPSYADLTAANTALGIGHPYYDLSLSKLQNTTA